MRRSREHSTLIPPRSPTTPFPEPQMRARGPHHQRPCSTVRAGPPARPESSRPNGAQRVVAHRRRRGTRRVVTAVTRHAQQHHVHRPLASEWRVLRCPRARRLPPCHLPLGHLEGGEQRHEESRPSHACDTGGSNFLRSPRTPHHGGRVMSFPFLSFLVSPPTTTLGGRVGLTPSPSVGRLERKTKDMTAVLCTACV
jgi:hypothetical protein